MYERSVSQSFSAYQVATREQVRVEMAARLDMGIRVNPMLARALEVEITSAHNLTDDATTDVQHDGAGGDALAVLGSGGDLVAADDTSGADAPPTRLPLPPPPPPAMLGRTLAPSRLQPSELPRPRVAVSPPTRHSLIRSLGEWIACHVAVTDAQPPLRFSSLVALAKAKCPAAAVAPSPRRIFLATLWMATTHNTTEGAAAATAGAAAATATATAAAADGGERGVALGLSGATQLPSGRQLVLTVLDEGADLQIALRPASPAT